MFCPLIAEEKISNYIRFLFLSYKLANISYIFASYVTLSSGIYLLILKKTLKKLSKA